MFYSTEFYPDNAVVTCGIGEYGSMGSKRNTDLFNTPEAAIARVKQLTRERRSELFKELEALEAAEREALGILELGLERPLFAELG